MKEMFKVGPIGSSNDHNKSWDEKGCTRITQIHVTYSKSHIHSIQFYYCQNGSEFFSEKYGSSSEGQCHKMIKLNHDEYVTGVSAIHLPWEYKITSLKFHTNQRTHGPICCESFLVRCLSYSIDKEYKRKIDVGITDRSKFGGLFGSFCKFGGYLTSIGIYVCPVTRNYEAVSGSASDQQLTYQSATPSIADGIPVKLIGHITHKPKRKDRIKAIWLLFKTLLD